MKEFKSTQKPTTTQNQITKHMKWEEYFSEFGRGISMYRTADARELVLAGMPDDLRSELWLVYSGKICLKIAHLVRLAIEIIGIIGSHYKFQVL